MNIKICKELRELNNIFVKNKSQLFIVGGYVRDSLLNYNSKDIDLSSSLTIEVLKDMLKNTGFKIKLMSNKMGTVIISKNKKSFEHTTFRSESYKRGGFHTPDKVAFVTDIKIDATRRDFTVNSLYYDLKNKKIIDFYDGINDLKNKKIRAIINPKYVFKSDGLRILRMVRIASELGFRIDNKTYKTAKIMIDQLKYISKDRLFKEFILTLNSKNKYDISGNGIKKLIKIGALDFIFPNLKVASFKHNKKLLKGFQNNLYNFNNNKYLKFESFMLDLCLHIAKKEKVLPHIIADRILNTKTCGVSVKKKNLVINLLKAYGQFKKVKGQLETRLFIQDNYKVINEILMLIDNAKNKKLFKLLKINLDYMKQNKIPFNLKELKVDGKMLKNEFNNLNGNQIGKALSSALKFCALEKENNTKENILKFLKEDKKLC